MEEGEPIIRRDSRRADLDGEAPSGMALSGGAALAPLADAVETPQTGLLEALVHVARFHGIAVNPGELTRGLPSAGPGLRLQDLEEAARRVGLVVRIEQRAVAGLPQVALPVIVVQRGEPAVAVEAVDRAKGTVRIPEDLVMGPGFGGFRDVPLEAFEGRGLPVVVFVGLVPGGRRRQQQEDTPKDWFWSAVRRFWPNYLQVVVAALIGNLLALASPLFIMNVYDRVIPNLAIPTLWALTAGVLIAFLFDFIFKMLRMGLVDETGRRVDMAVAGRMFDHVLRLKLSGRPASTGGLANQVRDLDSVRDALTSSTVIAATDLLFIGIFVWVMWFLVGPLAWVPALAVPLVVAVTALVQRPLSKALAQSQADAARRQSVLVETVGALETVKVSGSESWFRRAWDRSVAATSRSTTRARFWANVAAAFTGVVFQLVSIVIVVWGVFLVLEGRITIGALIAANILAGRVLSPLNNIAQTLARLLHARSALRSLDRLMEAGTETGVSARALTFPADPGLAFQDVCLTYPGRSVPALDKVSFALKKGEAVGVIGRVGSGKSSLVRVLAGLYEPQAGTYLLGGVDTRQFSAADLRASVGLCLQDAELFTGSLKDNILMGAADASSADLERAVHLAGVDTFSAHHREGLEMAVEERGRSLSGGQRQAVALARCLIRRPDILCLDEPSAYLDIMSERQLCQRLRRIAEEGVTLVIATHRDGPLDLVDRLLLLDRGKLVMDGPKEDVLARLKAGAQTSLRGGDDVPAG